MSRSRKAPPTLSRQRRVRPYNRQRMDRNVFLNELTA
jgi:hypothetical protein